jgi:TatD DNase family protein
MRFTDSHCHLTMSDVVGSLERARAMGVHGFVVPATKLEDAGPTVAIAREHDDVWAAVGFHPHETKDCDDAAFAEIEKLAQDKRVVAIGEIGLDYHYMHSPRETQRSVFMRHVLIWPGGGDCRSSFTTASRRRT